MKKTLIISGAGDIAKSIGIHLSVTSETISTTKKSLDLSSEESIGKFLDGSSNLVTLTASVNDEVRQTVQYHGFKTDGTGSKTYTNTRNNGTFDFSIKLYDEDGNIEDEEHYAHVELHVRSESNQTGEDVDEWFGDVDHRVDRDLLEIGFNPNTEFEGYTNVSIQINIYRDDGTGMLEDTISALIYSDDYDWIEYNWTAYEAGYYYFELRLFDENNNLEEEYYSDDIFLKGNESDNQAWFDSLTYTVTDADGDEKNDAKYFGEIK